MPETKTNCIDHYCINDTFTLGVGDYRHLGSQISIHNVSCYKNIAVCIDQIQYIQVSADLMKNVLFHSADQTKLPSLNSRQSKLTGTKQWCSVGIRYPRRTAIFPPPKAVRCLMPP